MTQAQSTPVRIPLTRGLFALVDPEDAELVSAHSWWAQQTHSCWYAMTWIFPLGRRQGVSMHRLILGLQMGDGRQADHINLDGLDNRRSNLRLASNSQNGANRRLAKNSRSGFKGVSVDQGKWRAAVYCRRRYYDLGLFTDPEEAARAYDAKAVELFGEFARPNFPRTTA